MAEPGLLTLNGHVTIHGDPQNNNTGNICSLFDKPPVQWLGLQEKDPSISMFAGSLKFGFT